MPMGSFAMRLAGAALVVVYQISAMAQPPAGAERLYGDYIRPVFEKSCLSCHGPEMKSSGLDLSTRDALLKGGDRGPAIVPGDPGASLLYKVVAQEAEPHMPYKRGPLPKETVDRIAEWIKAGAMFSPDATPAAPNVALFRDQIKPLLETNCMKCHSPQLKRSGLDLSSREAMLRGGDTGPVVVPGDASASILYKRVSHAEQPGMPFGAPKLPDNTIAHIADWINAGAPYDAPLDAGKASQEHWAFKLPKRPPVPQVRNTAWIRNPIDAFVAAEYEKRGLT